MVATFLVLMLGRVVSVKVEASGAGAPEETSGDNWLVLVQFILAL